MKRTIRILGFLLFAVIASIGEQPAKPVSMIQLIANPERFDGRSVRVLGYLTIAHEPKHGVQVILWLSEQDAKTLLNGVLVIPSKEMLRDEEKLNRMYVSITGDYHTIHTRDEDPPGTGLIKDVQSCTVWSDPSRPIGETATANKRK